MKSDLFPAGIPRLNHVAMSLPADRLDADGRAEILDFYGDCFGWTEIEEQTEDEVGSSWRSGTGTSSCSSTPRTTR